ARGLLCASLYLSDRHHCRGHVRRSRRGTAQHGPVRRGLHCLHHRTGWRHCPRHASGQLSGDLDPASHVHPPDDLGRIADHAGRTLHASPPRHLPGTGCNVALELGYTTTVVIMAGMTTGIFGGILRDILCNRTPMVLRKELYASVSLLVAILYLTLRHLDVNHDLNLLASFVFGLTIRLAAIRWSWSLPVFSYAPGRWSD